MHVYSSTQPLHNPLSLPTNWRFTAHLAPISEPSRAPLDEGRHSPDSPVYQGYSCRLFVSCRPTHFPPVRTPSAPGPCVPGSCRCSTLQSPPERPRGRGR